MTKKEKELIKDAIIVDNKELLKLSFDSIYMINSGKLYNGSWGKTGYNNIILLGVTKDNKIIKITNDIDVDIFELNATNFEYGIKFEIPKETNCFHIYILSERYNFKIKNMCSTYYLKIERNE